MKTEFKDVAYLYPQCEILEEGGNVGTILYIRKFGEELHPFINCSSNDPYWGNWQLIKPILRPLSDMKIEEMKELLTLRYHPNEDIFLSQIDEYKFHTDEPKRHIKHGQGVGYSTFRNGSHYSSGTLSYSSLNPYQFQYLLSKSFDLFGLIESGQAIDKTTLTNQPKQQHGTGKD